MIRFLSKMRLKFATENKPMKYLRYAIGEVALVVIGIILALQVNTWNEKRKNHETELVLYERILDDFELDQKLLNELTKETELRIQTARDILLDLNAQSRTKNYLLNQFLAVQRSTVFIPRDVTFRDLTSTGKLYLISDLEIKNSLIQYYSDLENKLFHLDGQRREMSRQVYDIDSYSEFGIYEFDYIHESLGPDILDILPEEDWTTDKNNPYYTKFQDLLLFTIAMNLRMVNHYNVILEMMETPYKLLKAKQNK